MSLEPNDGKPLLDRPANPLCTRCGLCCVMLSARVRKEEAEIISEENNLPQEKFCHIEKEGEGPNVGELVLNMPCKFLLGRPSDYTGCRIYSRTRPSVCETYLCRVAMQYKTGVLDLGEAVHKLRETFAEGRPALFNWMGLKGEVALQQSAIIKPLREEAALMVKEFGEEGRLGTLDTEEVGNILIAKHVTPTYLVHSDFAHLELNLLLNFFDRGDHELNDIIPQNVINRWAPEEQKLAMYVYTGLLAKIRSLFSTTTELKAKEAVDKAIEMEEGAEE